MTDVYTRLPRGVLALVALVAVSAVGAALVSQHVFDMKPCPWCIFQRVVFLAIALAAFIGWISKPRGITVASATAVLLLALGGVAAAVFQNRVAALDSSCALTFADRFLFATGLESSLPYLFQVTATCMEAASYRLLGLPFEVWSGLLFVLIALAAALVLRGTLAPPRGQR
ncbi:disulfide bond formation protein B [Rivibacter subsaxonicus]|uniref:Thiol:disulfide interchange protein DsbB n=1 Tax=Rivibacter subsaxonicus TaxID=457575 RepID=A0A4Q7VNH3_9BURK|nr:disulfide bond formation protein B [Rivibacter subsaxonicus]RZT97920.1 thiol:disulfide interchange protein DsbB [Rivibacter subsaxonicus]